LRQVAEVESAAAVIAAGRGRVNLYLARTGAAAEEQERYRAKHAERQDHARFVHQSSV